MKSGMSKHSPNQDYYKIGGRAQSDGADRGEDVRVTKEKFARIEQESRHPSVKRTAKKK